MRDYREIATRIAEIILSPESAIGLVHGVLSVPIDLGYLAYGYLDTESHYLSETETYRIIYAIRNGILDYERVIEAIETVLNQFDKHVSESEQNKIYSRTAFSVIGRFATNTAICSYIARAIAQRSSFIVTLRGGAIGNILLAGGMRERCIRTSQQLSIDEPELYQLLREKDYDLLYFLFKPALEPFVDALSVRRNQGQPAFDEIIKIVDKKIKNGTP